MPIRSLFVFVRGKSVWSTTVAEIHVLHHQSTGIISEKVQLSLISDKNISYFYIPIQLAETLRNYHSRRQEVMTSWHKNLIGISGPL